jgi:mono/diheme cytochrome c family protein
MDLQFLCIFIISITAMRKPLLLTSLLIALVFACNQHPEKSKNELLKTSALPSSFFTIDITKDTTLKTAKGAIIKIPKDALAAEGPSTIQLEVKEAYTLREMIIAGLTTQNNGQPLSSGGMIYINAVGEKTVRVEKAISISIPTPWLNKDMQLFKGEVQADSSINWANPDTIPAGESEKRLEKGFVIFRDNCSRCHAIGADLTGPDLAHVDKRWQEGGPNAYDFTWNSQKVLAEGDVYYNCLYEKWYKTPMPAFPELTREDMNVLYDYIDNASNARGIPYPKDRDACYDSCTKYVRKKYNLVEHRDSLIEDSENDYLDRPDSIFSDKVDYTQSVTVYYQFNIEALGWFNVDILMKENPGFVESELRVRIQGEYKNSLSVYLAIPSIRAFITGGYLDGKKEDYGFFDADGKIPLPPNVEAFILSMTETEGKIMYNSKAFIIQQSQRLEMSLKEVTKEEFNKAIRSLGFEDFNISIEDSKSAGEIRKTDGQIQETIRRIDSLKAQSKNCDCICKEIEAWYRNGQRPPSASPVPAFGN